MKILFETLTILNFIFIFDIIFLNSLLGKNLKKIITEHILDFIKKWLSEQLINHEENQDESQPSNQNNDQNSQDIFKDDKGKVLTLLEDYKDYDFSKKSHILNYHAIREQIDKLTLQEYYLITSIKKNLEDLKMQLQQESTDNKDDLILHHMNASHNLLFNYKSIDLNYKQAMNSYYNETNKEMLNEVSKFRKLNEIYKNAKTSQIYKNAQSSYSRAYYIYLGLAFISLGLALRSSFFLLEQKQSLIKLYGIDTYDYWTIKITSIFIFITLITFFIKQSVHYQKKKDIAERTRLELDALPTYISDFKDEEIKKIRQDLIPKYFGRDADNSTLNEVGNIITEQLKNSTEVAKSSAEVIKALKPK